MKLAVRLVALVSIVLASCTEKNDSQKNAENAATKTGAPKIGLVLDKGGRDDKSFNSAAFKGATQAATDFGIDLKDVESPDDAAFEPALRTFAERDFSLIIGIGFSQRDAVARVAKNFPKVKFAIVDAVVDLPNVRSLMFSEHEGSYLVGYAAGLISKTGVTGFIGGMDVSLIRRFQLGFEEGVKAAKPTAKVLVNYIGITSDAWANPTRGKELALAQYGKNADVVFLAAGASNLGGFDAAEEKKLYAIGVDSNQNWIKPGRIATSMLKRVDVAVYDSIKSVVENKFQSGIKNFGLAEKGIDYSMDEHNEKILGPHRSKLEQVKADIISGKIKVSDYYQTQKK